MCIYSEPKWHKLINLHTTRYIVSTPLKILISKWPQFAYEVLDFLLLIRNQR